MDNLEQGLQIVGIGIAGVFLNLLLLMMLVHGIGLLFGRKAKPKEGKSQRG